MLKLKCTKFDFGWDCKAYSGAPDPIAGFHGPTSKGKRWKRI